VNLVKFFADQWSLVSSAPAAFATYAVLLFGVGFAAGRLFYGTVTDVAKARLEAARDDLARLERRAADESKEASFLRTEVAALRADVERLPRNSTGTGPPDPSMGRNGDLYLQLDEDRRHAIPEGALFITPP
jgi:hypothetical protein